MEKISLNEIEEIFERLIEKLKFEEFKETSIDTDNYWIITADEWSDFENEVDPSVGSLIDDVEALKLLLQDNNRPCSFVDFDRFASVLRYISEKMNPSS